MTREELSARYDLSETDLAFIRAGARGSSGRLMLATLLKTRRDVGYFAPPAAVHPGIVEHLAAPLGVTAPQSWADEIGRTKALYRYQAAIRS